MNLRIVNRSGKPLEYKSSGAIALDLHALLREDEDHRSIYNGHRSTFDTGIHIEIPLGFGGLVMPRSGLAMRGIIAVTGVIDVDYRGAIGVTLVNHSAEPYDVQAFERIAQLLIVPVAHVTLEEVDALSVTERGSSGFGSSGKL